MDRTTLDTINWIKSLPKTEIHLHSEAVVSFATYMKLNEKYDIDASLTTVDDYKKSLNFSDLTGMINAFLYLQTFFREEKDFLLMSTDLLNYALNNNIYYMEIFFSPSKLLDLGYVDFFSVMDLLSNSFETIEKEHNIKINIIIDVSRSFGHDNAMNNLKLLQDYLKQKPNKRFLGIGLGGAEMGNSCVEYKDVFALARKKKMHVVAHAGEEVDASSIWDSIKELGVERIGHGTSAIYDKELLAYLEKSKLPLEICPTSNVITGKYVKKFGYHPIRRFFDAGINVTLNTDDPLLFNINLNKEYYKLYKLLDFSIDDLIQVAKNGLYATFLSPREKNRHWKRVQKVIRSQPSQPSQPGLE